MVIGGITGYGAVSRLAETTRKVQTQSLKGSEKAALRDSVEISKEGLESLKNSEGFTEEAVSGTEDREIAGALETAEETEQGENSDEVTSEKTGTSMGINAGKLARMLAAAKTRSQVRAVIALIESDIKECDAGKAQGADVDESSYKAAQRLLEQARSDLNKADDREATPQEEMAQALASLM